MLLKSEVTGKEYEVKTYPMDGGTSGICHESLQNILENELGAEVTYNVEALAATETYCAAKCTITDDNGRKVQGFNDVNTNLLEGRDDIQEKFAKAHPLIAAVQAAVDSAVRAYLKWPRAIVTNHYDGTSVIGEMPNVDELLDQIEQESSEASTDEDAKTVNDNVEQNVDAEKTSDFPGMNQPETKDMDVEAQETRLAELGKKNPPANSKYGKMTYDEIWEKYPSWFNYITKNSKSTTYADAKEYAELKQAQKEREQQ